jgi:hypothetical protein
MKSGRMGQVGHVACMRKRRKTHNILLPKHNGKTALERYMHTRRWEDNVEMTVIELG